MADRSCEGDTTERALESSESTTTTEAQPRAADDRERAPDGAIERRLPPDTADDLRAVADRIDGLAESLPFGPARHHARRAAQAARETADEDRRLAARRVAVGELVTELRRAADDAEATRTQYRLLELLYEEALPATRAAGASLY